MTVFAYLEHFPYFCSRKKFNSIISMKRPLLSIILALASLASMLSCVNDKYDMDKVDKTYHVGKASKSQAGPFYYYASALTNSRQDVIWQGDDFSMALPAIQGGYMLGTILTDIGYAFGTNWYTTEIELTATVTTDFPYQMRATVLPLEEQKNAEGYYDLLPSDKISVTPSDFTVSKGKETKIDLTFSSASEFNFYGFSLVLSTSVPTVHLNQGNYIALSDVKIKFPKGATVK